MKRSRFSEEQITYALRLADGGSPVADVCRQLGISEATFYVRKKSTPIWAYPNCVNYVSCKRRTRD